MKHTNYQFTVSVYVPEGTDVKQVFRALSFVSDKAIKGFDPEGVRPSQRSCASIIKFHNESARRRKNRLALAKQTPQSCPPQDENQSTSRADATSV